MRIAIVGSRDYPKMEAVRAFVTQLHEEFGKDLVIVSGGARGVDTAGVWQARKLGAQVKEWLAEWDRLGKKAGHVRNLKIVNDCDRLAAFHDGQSTGTVHVMAAAKRQGKLWKTFDADGRVKE